MHFDLAILPHRNRYQPSPHQPSPCRCAHWLASHHLLRAQPSSVWHAGTWQKLKKCRSQSDETKSYATHFYLQSRSRTYRSILTYKNVENVCLFQTTNFRRFFLVKQGVCRQHAPTLISGNIRSRGQRSLMWSSHACTRTIARYLRMRKHRSSRLP